VRARSSFYAVWWKSLELRIVLGVEAAVRDQKDAALARGIGELANIGQQAFGTRHVEFAAGEHEVCLRVDFPENSVRRYHCGSACLIVKEGYNIVGGDG